MVGPARYNQICCHINPGIAEARVRAGFMLVPERGASMMMRRLTSVPIARAVKGLRRAVEMKTKIVAMRRNEINVSAMNAISAPAGPGTVTAY
jgi:hypothetical protein